MNELATSDNLAPSALPQSTFATAKDYFLCLAEQHFANKMLQRNDAVSDEDDCETKYMARYLFRRVINEKEFEDDECPFRPFCDDYRPSNVLINIQNQCVAAVKD